MLLPIFLTASLLVSTVIGHHLVLVQTVFRHGDRTPTSTYPNDPYQESSWPASWGQLTNKGMLQHFEQGIKIRDRYIYDHPFINGEYHDFDVYVRSTDVNRTLMSAYAHIAGFYDNSNNTFPTGNGMWPTKWSPVPVHTVEIEDDHLLNTSPYCPRMDELHETLKSKAGFVSFMQIQEIWITDGGVPFIRARYIANVGATVEHITKYIKGCGGDDDCSYSDFKTRSQPFLGSHIHHMCGDTK